MDGQTRFENRLTDSNGEAGGEAEEMRRDGADERQRERERAESEGEFLANTV